MIFTTGSASAVSRSVSRLEREMGCKLLQRTTRKLRLSDAGETVYQHAQQGERSLVNMVGEQLALSSQTQGVDAVTLEDADGEQRRDGAVR